MESTICLLTEWTLKAGGHFKMDSMFLIKKGACAVVEDSNFHECVSVPAHNPC